MTCGSADADDCVDAAGWRQGAVRAARDVLHTRAGGTAAVDGAYAGALLSSPVKPAWLQSQSAEMQKAKPAQRHLHPEPSSVEA